MTAARRWLLGGAVLIVAVVGATWWWVRPAPLEPPTPPNIEDDEVLQAIRDAQQPVRTTPHSAAAWGQLGKVLLGQQFDREADICFAEASRLDPVDARWLYPRCVITLKRDPDHAVTCLRHASAVAAANDRTPADYRSVIDMQLAEALLERGLLDEAEPIFRAEQVRNAQNLRAVLGLGLIAQLRGETASAQEMLTAAVACPSARRFATVQLAALARTQGDKAGAEAYEKKIATLAPDAVWPDPFFEEIAGLQGGQRGFERVVKRLEHERRFSEAAELYLKRLEKKPTVQNYVGAATNLSRLRDYDRAFPLVRKAVALEPDNEFAHCSLALVVFARAEIEWHANPNAPYLKEWFAEARDHARRASELRPTYAEAYLWWGLALKYLGEPEAAIEPLRIGVAQSPADFRLQFSLGDVLVDTGRLKEAESYLDNARKLSPNDPRLAAALERLRSRGESTTKQSGSR
jgi:tetratricopeptide (TPR) repeat protein